MKSKKNTHMKVNQIVQERFAIRHNQITYNQDLLFKNPKIFEEKLREWIEIYNTKIPHKSLNYKTPMERVV